MSKTTINRLRGIDLFKGCTNRQLGRIDQLGITLGFAPGRALCVEGSPGSEFFVLVDGVVDVRTSATATVEILPRGSWFGEGALLDNVARRATVTARSESMIIVFGRREFNTLLEIAPQVRSRLERSAAFFADEPASPRMRWLPAAQGDAPLHAVSSC